VDLLFCFDMVFNFSVMMNTDAGKMSVEEAQNVLEREAPKFVGNFLFERRV